ncbi:MAG: YcxB family protein [Acidobacteria bacterium]|nr:YcxB family protein [Acidobacteriota bacterium]
MKLEYKLTLKDYKAAFRLHRRRKISRRLIAWLGPVLLVIGVIGFVLCSIANNTPLAAQAAALIAGSLVFTIGLPISRSWNIRRSFTRLFPSGENDRISRIAIDDQGICRELSGVAELKLSWNGIYDFAQNEKITLLYTNKDCFLLWPTGLMSTGQRAELDELVGRHVVKR